MLFELKNQKLVPLRHQIKAEETRKKIMRLIKQENSMNEIKNCEHVEKVWIDSSNNVEVLDYIKLKNGSCLVISDDEIVLYSSEESIGDNTCCKNNISVIDRNHPANINIG